MGEQMNGQLEGDNVKGLIFDIQHFCLDDGPGIRTTVFLKGCSLKCRWCHNPESISLKPERMRNAAGDHTCGKWCTPQAVLNEVLWDQIYYSRTSGGVTFSGGEPMLQRDFLLKLSRMCRNQGVSTALDTAGNVPVSWYSPALLENLDLILYDVKAVDPALHQRCTGYSNEQILHNLRKLSADRKRLWIRIPFIPGLTCTAEEVKRIAQLLRPLQSVERVWLLPYHSLGESKYPALGMEWTEQFFPPASDEIIQIQEQFKANEIG